MAGEKNLQRLLATMSPELDPETYVFVTTTEVLDLARLRPRLQLVEEEGLTLIVTRQAAVAQGLAFAFPCRRLTLKVHSSLEASGFLARVASHLAEHGIPVNPVAGYFHDHLFVPVERAEEALGALRALSVRFA